MTNAPPREYYWGGQDQVKPPPLKDETGRSPANLTQLHYHFHIIRVPHGTESSLLNPRNIDYILIDYQNPHTVHHAYVIY